MFEHGVDERFADLRPIGFVRVGEDGVAATDGNGGGIRRRRGGGGSGARVGGSSARPAAQAPARRRDLQLDTLQCLLEVDIAVRGAIPYERAQRPQRVVDAEIVLIVSVWMLQGSVPASDGTSTLKNIP